MRIIERALLTGAMLMVTAAAPASPASSGLNAAIAEALPEARDA